MKKENYQIGNIVLYKGEVTEITKELLGKYHLEQLDEPFTPIEITKEWLYRFGFRCLDGHIYTILDKGIYVSKLNLEHSGFWLLGSPKLAQLAFEIKHVHEIQNAVSHLEQTSIDLSISTEIEILGAKLFNLSPIEQQIEILKKQIELFYYEDSPYKESYKIEQLKLLSILEDLKEKE
ncbi:hypothetical protein MG290_01915 [Flavobacterium sp. CBA20B-1]|uniref:hypothetical protein n=1 Tax=unclassified Flavobacterium TaxID=196869 RepID=UPI002223FC1C|nr:MULTISPECIES: hypothetical protein [unclassified Flavobacterium]WCM42452.1 hypothetical protein MG290_01915 [Flavobacterium sp. CBA20B-1]